MFTALALIGILIAIGLFILAILIDIATQKRSDHRDIRALEAKFNRMIQANLNDTGQKRNCRTEQSNEQAFARYGD